MHTLIVGNRHVGKSTLIRKVREALGCSVSGYETKKESDMADPKLGDPIYIYRAGGPYVHGTENLMGYCLDQHPSVPPGSFDRAAHLLSEAKKEGELIIMDEIGFMETSSKIFCRELMARLDEEKPVLAAVKDKDTPFLSAVRSHPNCRCFFIDEEVRDAMYAEVLAFVKEQLERE